MKRQLPVLIVLALCATVTSTPAQFAPGRGGPMAAAVSAPVLGGTTAKLFGDNKEFSAMLEMQAGSAAPESGKITFSDGKTRFEIDMIKIMGSNVNTEGATQLKAMAMDKMAIISRPDKNATYLFYPGLAAYVETSTANAAPAKPGATGITTTRLGTETVDSHPCVENKVTVTEENGTPHESTVWNATDLKDFPVKIVQTEGGTTTTLTFKDISFDKVDPAVVDIPPGSRKYNDLGSLMQQEGMARAMRNRGGQ